MLNPFVDPPEVVVYKKGYVAWRNDFIFPDYEKRKDFNWKDKYVFKLEHFKNGFSHSQHVSFIRTALGLSLAPKLDQVYSWELELARKEDDLYRKKLKTLTPGETDNKRIWDEIMQELY